MRWLVVWVAALSAGCGWDWESSCSGILTTELECAMICGADPADYTWDMYKDSTQCGFCNCNDSASPPAP
ncbi:MAG: hypothetical protein JRG92_10105 [Deltaproteobacteria bacterium]|jgi:hypothetical protein|nr:hypothetical protein [Deltaproteobacteria bacterium]MBW2383979.1 hypothetical protein [Deltaproteobacteria bacterium]MBW2696344.1 hypothetical protein [Deltaproteobacteria bacterium]